MAPAGSKSVAPGVVNWYILPIKIKVGIGTLGLQLFGGEWNRDNKNLAAAHLRLVVPRPPKTSPWAIRYSVTDLTIISPK